MYDSVWAIALALNDTIAQLEAYGSMYKLEDFQYSNIEMANMMLENLQAVNFNGLSVHFLFVTCILCVTSSYNYAVTVGTMLYKLYSLGTYVSTLS